MNFLIVSLALVLDQLLGEPKRFHPLVGFGYCADWFERVLNPKTSSTEAIVYGALSLSLLVLPVTLLIFILTQVAGDYAWLLSAVILYWAIGLQSLSQHVKPIIHTLSNGDIKRARKYLARIVSRDTGDMDEKQITRSTIESTLENGCDSVFGAIFWFMLGGAPMVVFYRLVNALDAMWGYRDSRFESFGKVAARLDDILNFIPARLTALSYAVCGQFWLALKNWRAHASQLSSPNAGPVMTAGAGSLNLRLGGPAYYDKKRVEKPFFGGEMTPEKSDINLANQLVVKATLVWCALILLIELVTFIKQWI